MSVKKRNKDREAVVKRILKENKDELPADKILLSAENIRRGQNVINAITGRYGPEKAIYAPTNIGDDIAYTNGRRIVVNLSHDFIADEKTLNDKRMVEQGLYSHECGHVLFTDFDTLKTIFESWRNAQGISFNCHSFPYFDKKAFDDINRIYKDYPDIIEAVIMCVSNIFEDAYIEDKLKKIYKGSVKTSIDYAKSKLQKQLVAAVRDGNDNWRNLCLMVARDCMSEDIYSKYPVYSKIKRLNDANLNGFCSYTDRFGRSLSAIFLLWESDIKDEVEQAIKQHKVEEKIREMTKDELEKLKEQEQHNGMASSQTAPPHSSNNSSDSGSPSNSNQGNESDDNSDGQRQKNLTSADGNKSDENKSSEKTSDETKGKMSQDKDGSDSTNNSDGDNKTDGTGKTGETEKSSKSDKGNKKNDSMNGKKDYQQRSLFDDLFGFDNSSDSDDNSQKSNNTNNTDNGGLKVIDNGKDYNAEIGNGEIRQIDEDEYFDNLNSVSDVLSDNEKTNVGDVSSDEAGLISQALNEIVSNTPDYAEKIADSVELREIRNTDFHKYVDANVYHIRCDNRDSYNEIVEKENVLRISKNLQRKVKKDLFERRKGFVKHNLYSGKNIDLRAICNGSNKVFMQNKLPNNKPLLAASVLIDQSGSMCGTKIYKATVAAMMLEDFCRNLNIPCSVTGHCTSANTVNIYDYIDFGERNPNAKERLAAISCGGCNRDGYAIRYVANKLAKRSEETKLLFIVSDGLPNHSNYGTHELIADLADMNKKNRNKGIIIVPICIEKNCLKELSFIYGSSLVDATDLQKFPVKLNTILARELKKKLV